VNHGGRVVKTIGDEVMFVAEDVGAAVSIAYVLTRGVATDPDLPQARAGVASGRVLARDGDYYGPVVNFAHRLTSMAFAGSVVTDDAVHAALVDREGFEWTRLRARKVRDIGVVEAFRVNGVPGG
jgi:adenylate cyclase